MSVRRTAAALVVAALTSAIALSACSTPILNPPSDVPSDTQLAPADVMFVQMMIPHHEQAVEMSEILLAKPSMPAELRELATQIADEQGPEIAQMRAWFDDWGASEMGGMGGHAGHGGMDGMLSDAELTALREAEDGSAVELFLTQMIAHHEGAIDMAEDVIDGGRHPDVRELAEGMITSQRAEIALMTEWLAR